MIERVARIFNKKKKMNESIDGLSYLYDTHIHTSEASACGKASGAQQARYYKTAGYTGIIVTDHFFNGNSAIPDYLPWQRKVELFLKGYENAKEAGDRIGLDVFLGWEASFNATEFLVYGLDKDWLLSHPDILDWSVEEHYKRIKADGGFLVHAHPFREASYIKEVRLFPEYVDAVEAINLANERLNPLFNTKAIAYAKEHGLPMTEGSDNHCYTHDRGGMVFDRRLSSIEEYITLVEKKEGYRLMNHNILE